MEPAEYDRMNATEDVMWWYRAVHDRLVDALRRQPGPAGSVVLDAGCGTGGLLRRLVPETPGRNRIGIDVWPPALRMARDKSGAAVAQASATRLPFPDGCIGAVFSVDVICHRQVEPAAALAEIFRCLQPGGTLILNVPAYPWLMSFHDTQVHNARRFDRHALLALLAQVGFRQARARYWNCLLFPLMVLRRKLFVAGPDQSDVAQIPGLADRVFAGIMAVERFGARLGMHYPFGGSLLAVATR